MFGHADMTLPEPERWPFPVFGAMRARSRSTTSYAFAFGGWHILDPFDGSVITSRVCYCVRPAVTTAAGILARVARTDGSRRSDVSWERKLVCDPVLRWRERQRGVVRERRTAPDWETQWNALIAPTAPCRTRDLRVVHASIALDMPGSLIGLRWPTYRMLLRGEIGNVVPENLREMGLAGGAEVVCRDGPLDPSTGSHLAMVYEGLPRERAEELVRTSCAALGRAPEDVAAHELPIPPELVALTATAVADGLGIAWTDPADAVRLVRARFAD